MSRISDDLFLIIFKLAFENDGGDTLTADDAKKLNLSASHARRRDHHLI